MKMCNYDMRFIFQLLPDAEVDRLFSAATEEKIHARQRGSELRKIRRQDGSTEEIDGSQIKYKRIPDDFYLEPKHFQVF